MRTSVVAGATVPVIGLGTWQFSSRAWGYGPAYDHGEAVRIVRRALELGVTLVDTAEVYGWGRSERTVGRALGPRRPAAFLATKLYPVLPVRPVVVWRGRASAARLGVDRLDLYQVHAPHPVVPLGTTMRGMADLQRAGVVDRVGVSNFTLAQWQRADAALGAPVFSDQVRYSLAVPGPGADLVPFAEREDRLVLAYSPLAQGLLSGRHRVDDLPQDVRRRNPLFLPGIVAAAQELLSAVAAVARREGATSAQVALAWLVRSPHVTAVPGARTVAQLEENAEAGDLVLREEDQRWLTEVSARFRPVGGKREVRRHLRAQQRGRRRPGAPQERA